jgi:hypothetical protein
MKMKKELPYRSILLAVKRNTLHVHTAKMDTPYTSTLQEIEKDTPCTPTEQAVEKGCNLYIHTACNRNR